LKVRNKKIVVITENICQNNAFFIGPLSDREREIVEFFPIINVGRTACSKIVRNIFSEGTCRGSTGFFFLGGVFDAMPALLREYYKILVCTPYLSLALLYALLYISRYTSCFN